MKNSSDKKIDQILADYEKAQTEFENHPLWRELQTTPKEFFKKVHEIIEKSGIDKQVWQEKLNEAKHNLQIHLREKTRQYQSFNFNHMAGIKA